MNYNDIKDKALSCWQYCSQGVWQDMRTSWSTSAVKVINLTVRGFFNGDLQSQACAMTFRTLLAVVPLLALLFAIGRGFGLGEYLQEQILSYFPSQQVALNKAFSFVESYLAQASEGIFVGVGIIFLLWTLISLLSSVEEVFNKIWNVTTTRSLWRKLADYTAILLILPILMICAGGIKLILSTTIHNWFNIVGFFSPLASWVLDITSIVLTWLFFAGCYALIPNAKVQFSKALVAGIFAGSGFQILQWIFVSGQMYVAKYNAIYGSFSFLPLMLIWLQLVWLITFIGAQLCYSSQNIFRYSFESDIDDISPSYRMKVTLAILTVIVKRFKDHASPITSDELVSDYRLPPRLVDDAIAKLVETKLICGVSVANSAPLAYQPTQNTEEYTVGSVAIALDTQGASDFIPDFKDSFAEISSVIDAVEKVAQNNNNLQLTDINIPQNNKNLKES